MRVEVTLTNEQERALTKLATVENSTLDTYVTAIAQEAVQTAAVTAVSEQNAQLLNAIRDALTTATRNQRERIAAILGVTP